MNSILAVPESCVNPAFFGGPVLEKLLQGLEKQFNRLPNIVQILAIGGGYAVFQLLVPVLLFDYSSELGIFWILILLAYTALLVVLTAWLFYRREIRYLEGMYGTDFVFQAFPKERRRRERKAQKARKRRREPR